jgi:hypothetical protein
MLIRICNKLFTKGGIMSDHESNGQLDKLTFTERLNSLESRIASLEKEILDLKISSYKVVSKEESQEDFDLSLKLPWQESEGGIETKIGEYGLAWLGNIVLFFGIVFLTHFISSKGYPLISGISGLMAFAGIMIFARSMRKSYESLAFIFTIFGHILLFYTVVRLHYFTSPQVIANKAVIIILLLSVVGYQFFEAVRRKSEGFVVMAFLLTLTLAVLSDSTHVFLPLITLCAAASVFLFNRFGWYRLLTLSVIFNYLLFFIWLLNNPLMGHELKAVSNHQYCFFYLAFCGAIYSMITLIRPKDLFPDGIILSTVIMNGLGFSVLLGLLVISFFPTNYILIFATIAIFCLVFSAILKYRSSWKYSPALYALYAFVAISVTLYGIFNFPMAYLFLTLQSLLVVSIALWFRSRIIVVMNLFLFMTLLIGYIAQPVSLILTNFSFPVVAFFSARIIRWQKERLNIKTELIRNTYLVLLFLTMLHAVYKAVPGQYITLSWTLVAVLYLLLSIIFKNVKYRYLMFATLIATAFYLFAVDLARIEMIFRIIAFLFLAIISIGISIYYVNKIKKKQQNI